MAAALAHHDWSGYETEIQKLSGVIEQSSYSNPHGVDPPEDGGQDVGGGAGAAFAHGQPRPDRGHAEGRDEFMLFLRTWDNPIQ
jgi:hypothetical protein